MKIKTATSLFMPTSCVGFYQQLLTSGRSFQEIGNKLIHIAERAHAIRYFDRVREAGEILSNLPIEGYRNIGQFYLALSMCRNGMGGIYEARPLLERLASDAPMTYRAKALQLLAATYGTQRNPEQELYFYLESLKTKAYSLQTLRGIAVLKAKEGYHKYAVKDLESLLPIAKYAPPHIYFDYLNSLAVELSEVGRKDEARNIIKHVLASPYAFAYPEWRSTAEDLRPANRSFAVIRPTRIRKGKLLFMPQPEYVEPTEVGSLAPVISLPEWKEKMAKDNDKPKLEDMTESEIMMEIIHTVSAFDMPYEKRLKVLESIRKIMAEPSKPDDDDED